MGVAVPPAGIEPATCGVGGRCSVPLSYEGDAPAVAGRDALASTALVAAKTSAGKYVW